MKWTIICAWCGRFMGSKSEPAGRSNRGRVTHTICDDCRQSLFIDHAAHTPGGRIHKK